MSPDGRDHAPLLWRMRAATLNGLVVGGALVMARRVRTLEGA